MNEDQTKRNETELQLEIAKTQALSEWVNSLLVTLAAVVIALGVLFATPYFTGTLSIDAETALLSLAGIMLIVGSMLFFSFFFFNLGYMPRRWNNLQKHIGNRTIEMSKRTKIPKKDAYLLILGFVLGFLGAMAYGVAHDFAFAFNATVNWYWIFLQVCFLTVFGALAYWVLRKVDQEI